MSEDRASWYDPKQRMTTAEAWATRRKVGPSRAAEIEKDQRGLLLKTGPCESTPLEKCLASRQNGKYSRPDGADQVAPKSYPVQDRFTVAAVYSRAEPPPAPRDFSRGKSLENHPEEK